MKILVILSLLFSSYAMAKLTNESEFSSVTTGGNSSVETYLGKTLHLLTKDKDTYKFGGMYTYGEANKIVSARNWYIDLKFDHLITQKVAWYTGEYVEGYTFQGIKARYNS